MLAQFNISYALTACRLVATSNQTGVYYNGLLTNGSGVGATFTYPIGTIDIDSIVFNIGDRILFISQSISSQNGIYIVKSLSNNLNGAVLKRTEDFQSVEQLLAGQYVSIGAGDINAGNIYTLIEPIPNRIGIDAINFSQVPDIGSLGTAAFKAASNTSFPFVSSVDGAVAGQVAIFNDGFGTITADGVLGQAAFKNVSDNSQPNVSSVVETDPTPVMFNLIVFNDTLGTIRDAGYYLHASTALFAGGSNTFTITDTKVTDSCVPWATINSSTNLVSVCKVTQSAGSLLITFSADPGAGTVVNYFLFSSTI